MFIVYIIKNSDNGKMYTGYTSDIEKRLLRHNQSLPIKKSSFTFKNKSDGEWVLVYKELYETREKAMERERWLKTGVGREYIKKIVL